MFESSAIIRKLKKLKARKVYLQVPEGLKTRVQEISKDLEDAGFVVMISVEPCFGACDLRDREANSLGCDVLVHVGHSDFGVRTAVPVIYEEYRIDFDPTALIRTALPQLKKYKVIGLVSTVQYLGALSKASAILRKSGKKVLMGSAKRAAHPGQILGCDYSSPKSIDKSVDCFLFLGTGKFHPLGLSLDVEKPVLFLDFETSELIDLKDEKFTLEKMKYARIAKAGEARNFGILVSSKPGQMHARTAMKVKERLDSLGRNAWIFAADQITPEKLLGLKIEALVDTACPRLREDSRQFKKPIISPEDIDLFPEC